MLLHILLVALVSSLVTAETCPDGKLSCPTDKRCCFEAGQYTCCHPDEVEDDLLAGAPITNYRNVSSDQGIQHAPFSDYCPNTRGQRLCCTSRLNCVAYSECCTPTACCMRGQICCGRGGWCCYKGQRCGPYSATCINAGVAFVPAIGTIALIAFATIKFKSDFF